MSPFESQLEHIFLVTRGKQPDHFTCNAVRSVLEAIGRFCMPDKRDLGDFIAFLAGEENFTIQSVLINSMSHGTYMDETPSPEDISQACEEAIIVAEHFAKGQIELL